MENTNKPQWLIDAENKIQKFEESKYGKMNNQQLAASIQGKSSNNWHKEGVYNPANTKGVKKTSLMKSKISHTLKNKKTANHIYVKCPNGFITTKPSAMVYCNARSLNYNECVTIKNFKIKDLYVHILNLLPFKFKTGDVDELGYHTAFTNFIKYCIENNLVINKNGRKGFYKKIV